MRFTLIFAALALLLATPPAPAKDLPDGAFLLVGDVFPGIKQGHIVPVQAHVRTGGDSLEWTFFTYFGADATACELNGKCSQFVRTLTHRVAWDDDGTLRILDTQRTRGPGLTIDRPDLDDPFIYGAIEALLSGGTLTLTGAGGQIVHKGRRSGARVVDLLPATLDQADMALSLAGAFELSLFEMDYCVIRQVLGFAADPAPTPAMRQVLAAARLAHEIRKTERVSGYYLEPPDNPVLNRQRRTAGVRRSVFSIALGWPARDAAEALAAGAPLSDDAIRALVGDALARVRGNSDPAFERAAKELEADWMDEVLAAVRLMSRYTLVTMEGKDPLAAVCADVTLGG